MVDPNGAPPSRHGGLTSLHALIALVALALLLLAVRPGAHVFSLPITEDAYYALTVARNAAAGHGFVIEPGIFTNGFQPLFTVLEAAAFALGGADAAAIRWIIVLSWIFHLGAAGLIGLVAGAAWPAATRVEADHRRAWAALLYLAAPLVVNHAYNGLETGAALFFYLALARMLQIGKASTRSGAGLCGVLAGMLVLTRIDSAIVVAVVTVAIALRGLRSDPIDAMTRAAIFCLVAFVVSLPWWAFNVVQFGSPMPTSGLAQQGFEIAPLRLAFAATALGKVLMPWIFVGTVEGALAQFVVSRDLGITTFDVVRWLLAIAAFVLLWLSVRRSRRDASSAVAAVPAACPSDTRWVAGAMAVGFGVIVAYYTFNFTAYWFYYRYFAPLLVFSVVPLAVAAGRMTASSRSRRAALVAACVIAVQGIAFTSLAWNGVGLFGQTDYWDQVELVNGQVPSGEAVAAGQSGTLGFFRARVVNLDGKVNSDVLRHQERTSDYLRARGVRWFCDWPHYARRYLGVALDPVTGAPPAESNGWRLVGVRGYFFLYEDAMRRPEPASPADEAIAMNLRRRQAPRGPSSGGAVSR